ncbi:MAG: 30S ribosomal protein S2 [Chloroflexi bacterium]|nr:30S ribosomal protein S2 [Chloroflexota bacterium]
MPFKLTLKDLLESGCHFGHQSQKWNPKMAPYLFTKRNGIHILDLRQTIVNLRQHHELIVNLVAEGGEVLFVSTKRQAQEVIQEQATRCRMPYVTHRWLGGMLTNWRTIRERIDTLKQLEERREAGEFDQLTKKERLMVQRKIDTLQLRLGGIRGMTRLPKLLFVVDTIREVTAVKEANILGIPVLAMVDSNSDPDAIEYLVPANDDAMRSIRLIVTAIADAVLEGNLLRESGREEEDDDSRRPRRDGRYALEEDLDQDEDDDDERYLGEATLRKLREAEAFADEAAPAAEPATAAIPAAASPVAEAMEPEPAPEPQPESAPETVAEPTPEPVSEEKPEEPA